MKHKTTIMLFVLLAVTPFIGNAIAQDVPGVPDIPINISGGEIVVVIIGSIGGLTTAYLGSRKAKAADPEKYKFDIHKFGDRVLLAVITSIGLAITSAAGFIELNLVTMYLIFVASIGNAELILQARAKAKSKNP